jgi:hypothetical protein
MAAATAERSVGTKENYHSNGRRVRPRPLRQVTMVSRVPRVHKTAENISYTSKARTTHSNLVLKCIERAEATKALSFDDDSSNT